MGNVLRILLAVTLLVVVAGCGGAARPQRSAFDGVPPAVAHDWESRASAIATAAEAGNSCRALQLANSLRTEVKAKEHKVPVRLRSPLLTGVTSLADGITCTPVSTTTTQPEPPKPHGPPGHEKDHHRDHHGGHDKGHEG